MAAWSTNGWLPSGHALRMALDLGLHRALEKLAEDNGKKRSEEEERNLGKSINGFATFGTRTLIWLSRLGPRLVLSLLVRPPVST